MGSEKFNLYLKKVTAKKGHFSKGKSGLKNQNLSRKFVNVRLVTETSFKNENWLVIIIKANNNLENLCYWPVNNWVLMKAEIDPNSTIINWDRIMGDIREKN